MMKRGVDLVAAVLGLAVLWPLIALAAVAIRLESPGPAIFAQTRVGRRGQLFTCYKLRTMRRDAAQVPTHMVGASAVTPLGKIFRRLKLDELPQLYNVIRGEMSLVGPRPCLPSQTELIELRTRHGALEVLPGITGLAQVQGIDMSDPARLAAIDGEYARNATLAGDFKLILRTLVGSGLGVDQVKS
jgi:O-antigen biosynthesis protein WbqP